MKKKDQIIEDLMEIGYIIPIWCKLPVCCHSDGLGGCWGVSYNLVKERGEDYCRGCENYGRK